MTCMGRMVPPMDAWALAQAVINILDHPEQYSGDAQAVAQQFSAERVAEEYEEVFKRLNHKGLQGHKGKP